jgi:protein TonB
MLEQRPKPTAGTSWARAILENKQRRRLWLALALLLGALALVFVRERQFWFGGDESQAENSEVNRREVAHQTVGEAVPKTNSQVSSVPAPRSQKQAPASKPSSGTKVAESSIVATNRVVLPPMDVDVVAGDTHRTVHPASNAAKVEIANSGSAAPPESTVKVGVATDAAGRERIAAGTVQVPERSVEASYLLLSQQTKVEGSVILQALVGVDGAIEDLWVLSGPPVLAAAAQQAVRQWRFKPYLQNGRPVETKAKIIVNFTIKVLDNTPKNS